jgi:hypothetical protein
MSDPFVIALFALGISVTASAVRAIDWFLHSDPKLVARTARFAAVAVAALSIPLLIVLLVKEQWTAATALAAAMILIAALSGRRMLRWIDVRPLMPDRSASGAAGFGNGRAADLDEDPELVRRAAAILEAYVRRRSGEPPRINGHVRALEHEAGRARTKANGHAEAIDVAPMSQEEALAILGLQHGAAACEIDEAHHRIAQNLSPDSGGSPYLAAKVDLAKQILLRAGMPSSRKTSVNSGKRKPRRRRPLTNRRRDTAGFAILRENSIIL